MEEDNMKTIAGQSLPALCHSCRQHKRSFWEVEYEMDCADCREHAVTSEREARLKAAFAAGKIKESDLTPLGRSICLTNK